MPPWKPDQLPPVLAFSLRPATVRAGRCKRSRPALFARTLFHSLKRESMVKWLKVALHKKPCMKTPVVRGSGARRVGDDILRSAGWYRLWEQLRAARRAAR